MNYQKAINWMFKQLPMYQRIGKAAYKIDLSNTIRLANHLKNPHLNFKSVHVAGTNGKGSTCHMLASVLQEAGYKVGLYTSPHLKDFRERIKINGNKISKLAVIGFIKKNKTFLESNNFSFFEMTVGLAFEQFSKQKVDIAIIEVGLGGRLDSTNIIRPEVSVITNIGLDHTQFLGNTIELIAAEKAGIIKLETPVVIGETNRNTKNIFLQFAKQNKAEIVFADKEIDEVYKTDLTGSYQINNLKTAIQTIKELQLKGFKISKKNTKQGLLNVVKNTGLNGRWQILQEKPKVICDTAHNIEGLNYVLKQLMNETFNKLHIVFGVVSDKNLDPLLKLLPKKAIYYLCKPNIERGLDVEILSVIFKDNNFESRNFNSVSLAYTGALKNSTENDLIFIGGSTFVVAEIL